MVGYYGLVLWAACLKGESVHAPLIVSMHHIVQCLITLATCIILHVNITLYVFCITQSQVIYPSLGTQKTYLAAVIVTYMEIITILGKMELKKNTSMSQCHVLGHIDLF